MKSYGGMLSFEIDGNLNSVLNILNKLKFCSMAPTLGDVDTLVLHSATSSHINVDKSQRDANGIRFLLFMNTSEISLELKVEAGARLTPRSFY